MLIQIRYKDAIADGSVTLTFRRWRRPRWWPATPIARRPGGSWSMRSTSSTPVASPSPKRSGRDSRRGPRSSRASRGTPDLPTYRIRFHAADRPRSARRARGDGRPLRRRDRRPPAPPRSPRPGELARSVDDARCLQTIAARPAVRAADLAAGFGRETQPFKLDVRKLKNLGLTLSLEVGYRLSPRGEAFLAAVHAS